MRFTNDFTLYAGPKNKMGKTVYYVRIRDESGHRHSGRSTGETSRSVARRKVLALIAEGRFTPSCAHAFSAFAGNRWVPGSCTYLKAAANNGSPIGRHHASVQRSYLTVHILPTSGRLSCLRSRCVISKRGA